MEYTFTFQSPQLLEDIRDFHESKTSICAMYYDLIVVQLNEMPSEDKLWLINDLISHMNYHQPTINGYIFSFYYIFFRRYGMNTPEKVDRFMEIMENKTPDSQINILWSLMSPLERKNYIEKYSRIMI
jgi:hypothetical protein